MLRLSLLVLLLLPACAGSDSSPLGVALTERFGAARTETDTSQQKLTIRLTDSRWEGMEDVVADSGRVVARFALDHLPADAPRPLLVEVHFQVERSALGLFGATSGVGLLADSL
jgi:hypothetical protein